MKRHFTTGFFLLVLSLLTALSAQAQAPGPEKVLEQASEQLFDALERETVDFTENPRRLFEIVDESLGPHVDFPLVSQWVLGRYWRTASEPQKERFMQEFRQLLIRFYVSALLDDPAEIPSLLEHRDELITFLPAVVAEDRPTALVRSEVHLPSGQEVPVSFNVHNKGGAWKVYDVNVEGISLVKNYRSNFAAQIKQSGLDQLLDDLEQRNRELMEKTGQITVGRS